MERIERLEKEKGALDRCANVLVERVEKLAGDRNFVYGCGMDLSRIRAITNDYQDVRLVSLRHWKAAHEIEPRDQGGPYIVVQQGYDPQEVNPSYDEFLLGRSGVWLPVGLFFKIPVEERRKEYVFGTAGEVVELLETLLGNAKIVRKGTEISEVSLEEDDLAAAFKEAKEQSPQKPNAAAQGPPLNG